MVEFLIDFKSGWQEAAEARRQAAAQLIQLREREWMLAQGLAEYAESVALLVRETDEHAQRLARRGTVSVRDYGARLDAAQPRRLTDRGSEYVQFFKGKTSVAASAPPPGGNGPRPAGMALLPAPRSEADQVRDFQEGLVKLQAAIQRNKGLRAKLDAIQNMGAWSAVWGALSGGNDRDLAEMLSEYGASLETTQSAAAGPGAHRQDQCAAQPWRACRADRIDRGERGRVDADGNAAYMVMQTSRNRSRDLIEAADGYERCWQEVRSLRDALDAQDVQLGRQDGALDGLQEQVRQIERGMQAAEQAARPRKSGQARLCVA